MESIPVHHPVTGIYLGTININTSQSTQPFMINVTHQIGPFMPTQPQQFPLHPPPVFIPAYVALPAQQNTQGQPSNLPTNGTPTFQPIFNVPMVYALVPIPYGINGANNGGLNPSPGSLAPGQNSGSPPTIPDERVRRRSLELIPEEEIEPYDPENATSGYVYEPAALRGGNTNSRPATTDSSTSPGGNDGGGSGRVEYLGSHSIVRISNTIVTSSFQPLRSGSGSSSSGGGSSTSPSSISPEFN